ncbi:MAG: hypothetical protein M0P33_10890 [Massilibacteroides sp.]|nr:hypothetical protein [Massilibacteroides sp.]
MKKCSITIALCLFVLFIHAVDHLRIGDVRSIGMGLNGVIESTQFNPALLSQYQTRRFTVGYVNRYGLKELSTLSASLFCPLSFLDGGIDVVSFGNDDYRESLFRLAFSKDLSEQWSLGVSFQYAFVQSLAYELNPGQVATDVGLTFKPVENVLIGLLVMNLPSTTVGSSELEMEGFMDYSIQLGLHYTLYDEVLITASVEHNKTTQFTGSFGMEYKPLKGFALRAGIHGEPFMPSVGTSIELGPFQLDSAAFYDTYLGISPAFSLSLDF